MSTLNRTEQCILAGLLTLFVAGSGLLAWQQRKLDRSLNALAPQASDAVRATAAAVSKPPRIDLQTATAEEWEQLPGIGPALARDIVAYRQNHPLQSPEDLDGVPGIGPKKIEKIRPYVSGGHAAE